MDLKEKKQKLAEIKEEFEYGMFQNGKVENIGTIFFLYYTGACVLRDVVYYRSLHYGIQFETLCMTSSYFIGSKAHAEALFQAFGGKCMLPNFALWPKTRANFMPGKVQSANGSAKRFTAADLPPNRWILKRSKWPCFNPDCRTKSKTPLI